MGGCDLSALHAPATARSPRHALPHVSPALFRWFLAYASGYARRNFHAIRVAEERHALAVAGRPLLIYMNHPSWWDPIVAAVLAKTYFQGCSHYTPMDADALAKYKFFGRLGFFGMKQGASASARKLLDIGQQALARNHSVLWMTPQARFSDVRERPLKLASGLSHLVRHAPNCVVLPVALEYAFWEERTPEALVRFAPPLTGYDLREALRVPRVFELLLEETLDALAQDSIRREVSHFRTILSGRAGVGGLYDVWRRLRARLSGRPFIAEHGKAR